MRSTNTSGRTHLIPFAGRSAQEPGHLFKTANHLMLHMIAHDYCFTRTQTNMQEDLLSGGDKNLTYIILVQHVYTVNLSALTFVNKIMAFASSYFTRGAEQ